MSFVKLLVGSPIVRSSWSGEGSKDGSVLSDLVVEEGGGRRVDHGG